MRCSASVAAALLALAAACSSAAAAGLPLRIGQHTFQAELAATPRERERGLMGRARLAPDGAMLFVFDAPGRHCFWMRNTPLPLSIAFIDDRGRISSLADMQPFSDAMHCPAAEVRYALEVAQGEFRQRGINPGAQVEGLPR